jgi:threonylcarbamoyladenosine tRNA methylthiotransferase MtaB
VKYSVVTFGCRVNQADSLSIERRLKARGGVPAAAADADVVVVNTCSVTASADQGARQMIRRIARDNPSARIVVTGCYATRRPDEVRELPNVSVVVGNDAKDTYDDFGAPERFEDGDGPCGAALEPGTAGRTAFTLRVQTGCEEACSYCIIPLTRGASRSKALSQVVREMREAIEAGYKEIAVTGVHLGAYGRDLDEPTSLEALVRVLAGWPGEVLFRISSLEPMDCSDGLVDLFAASPRLAPHFHLPLQHGCNAMLAAMRRPYSAEYYERLVTRIHARLPDAAIGSDIIVGFPGETADQFERMAALLERLPLSHLHVFPYSDRPGTAAARLPGKVEGATIRERGRRIRQIGDSLAHRFKESQIGRTHRALTVDDGRSVVTGNYLKLAIDAQRPRNEWVEVAVLPHQQGHLLRG